MDNFKYILIFNVIGVIVSLLAVIVSVINGNYFLVPIELIGVLAYSVSVKICLRVMK